MFTIKNEKHNQDPDDVQAQPNEHEGALVAGEESRRRAQAKDRQNVSDVMEAASHHRGDRSAAIRTHQRAGVTCGCGRDEQAKAQDGIESGLNAQGDKERQNVPAVAQELTRGLIPTLRPNENTKVNAGHQRGAEQECSKWDEITLHNKISLIPMIARQPLRVFSQIAVRAIGIYAYPSAAEGK